MQKKTKKQNNVFPPYGSQIQAVKYVILPL